MAIAPHKARNSADRIVGIETREQLLVSINEYYDASNNKKILLFSQTERFSVVSSMGFIASRSHAAG